MTRIFIYNENCAMAGREVPQRELDRYEDPTDGGDWTGYEVTEEEAASHDGLSPYYARIAATIREALAWV